MVPDGQSLLDSRPSSALTFKNCQLFSIYRSDTLLYVGVCLPTYAHAHTHTHTHTHAHAHTHTHTHTTHTHTHTGRQALCPTSVLPQTQRGRQAGLKTVTHNPQWGRDRKDLSHRHDANLRGSEPVTPRRGASPLSGGRIRAITV